jgi:xylitol oxidase
MKNVISVDKATGRVVVQGGITYGELAVVLQSHGMALHNLASLPHISVVGAVSTATHGSGQANGNLASAVLGMQILTGDGSIVDLHQDKDPKALQEAVVGLGCLGVVTQLEIKVEPSFDIRQRVFDGLFLSSLSQGRLDAALGAGYSVSLFTSWTPSAEANDIEFHVWLKQKVGSTESSTIDSALSGCIQCSEKQHPLKGVDPKNCTEQAEAGPWHERLPHFHFDFQPGFGEELQSEYFVPRARAAESLHALSAVAPVFSRLLLVSEVRSIAADSLLLSPHAERHVGAEGSVGLHFTWHKQEAELMQNVLPAVEKALEPFQARPHWGKLFTMPQERLEELYGGALSDFRLVMQRYDPTGRFSNTWIQDTIGVPSASH